MDVGGSKVLYGDSVSGEWGPPIFKLMPVAVPPPLHLVGKGYLTDTPNRRDVLALGSDLLRVMELQLAWVWEVTNGLNPGEQ